MVNRYRIIHLYKNTVFASTKIFRFRYYSRNYGIVHFQLMWKLLSGFVRNKPKGRFIYTHCAKHYMLCLMIMTTLRFGLSFIMTDSTTDQINNWSVDYTFLFFASHYLSSAKITVFTYGNKFLDAIRQKLLQIIIRLGNAFDSTVLRNSSRNLGKWKLWF